MQGLALVDWYNFRRRDQNSKADLELVTMNIVEQVSRAFATLFPDARELISGCTEDGSLSKDGRAAMRRG